MGLAYIGGAPSGVCRPDLRALDSVAMTKSFHRGEDLSGGAASGASWCRLISGAAKRCATLPNGRQQILDLLLPGDIFDCGSDVGDNFSIEAAVDRTTLAYYPRRKVDLLVNSDARLGRLDAEIAAETIHRLQSQLLIVSRTTALEKIAAFLITLAERQAGSGKAVDGVTLPVSRYDIADYLGLSVETVSRSLSGLKERGLISFTTTRAIKIIDRDALENCSEYRGRACKAAEHHRSRWASDGARLAMTARRMASANL